MTVPSRCRRYPKTHREEGEKGAELVVSNLADGHTIERRADMMLGRCSLRVTLARFLAEQGDATFICDGNCEKIRECSSHLGARRLTASAGHGMPCRDP